jgi:hypothetical protein
MMFLRALALEVVELTVLVMRHSVESPPSGPARNEGKGTCERDVNGETGGGGEERKEYEEVDEDGDA